MSGADHDDPDLEITGDNGELFVIKPDGKVWGNPEAARLNVRYHRRESSLRSAANRQGFVLRKSRLRVNPNLDNYGGYRIVERLTNRIEAGERYDLDLDDVERFLRRGRGMTRARWRDKEYDLLNFTDDGEYVLRDATGDITLTDGIEGFRQMVELRCERCGMFSTHAGPANG